MRKGVEIRQSGNQGWTRLGNVKKTGIHPPNNPLDDFENISSMNDCRVLFCKQVNVFRIKGPFAGEGERVNSGLLRELEPDCTSVYSPKSQPHQRPSSDENFLESTNLKVCK